MQYGYGSTSDERIKTNIKTIENALDKTLLLRGVEYNDIRIEPEKKKIGLMNNNSYIPNNEHFLKRARNIRNELLNRTDKYILNDYPISLEQQMIIKAYRQNLRNFINDNKEKILNGEKIDFPKQPDFIDLNIIY